MQENKMGVMPIPKLVISMSLPIMISLLIQSLYNIVDSIFVARISEEALSATSIAYSAQMLQIAVAVGTSVGMNAVVSRYLGAKQYDKANASATMGLFLNMLSSLIFVVWGIFGTKAFISLFTNDTSIIEMGTSYLRICQLFCTGIFLSTYAQRLLQSTGRTFSSMMAHICGAVTNLILDPILIFGLFHFPVMGISGAAIATVIGQWVAAIAGLLFNKIQNKDIHLTFHGFWNWDTIRSIYKVGAPTILTQSFGSIMIACMNMILATFSTTAVAFFGVYFKLQSFLFMPMNGLGQGSLPIIGFNYGAKNKNRILETCKVSMTLGICIGLVGTLIFMVFPKTLLSLFAAGQQMIQIGVPALRIISCTFVLASFTMITGYILSGLGNGMVNMIACAIRQIVILLPCVYLIGQMENLSLIWFAFWISEAIAFVFALYSLKKGLKKM